MGALLDHGKRMSAKLPPMPDPKLQTSAFVAWMQRHAVPADEYFARYPEARDLRRRLAHARARRSARTNKERLAETIFNVAEPYLLDPQWRDVRGPKWKAIARQLQKEHAINVNANQLRMIARGRVRTTSSSSADHM